MVDRLGEQLLIEYLFLVDGPSGMCHKRKQSMIILSMIFKEEKPSIRFVF